MHTYQNIDGSWQVGYWRGDRWEWLRVFRTEDGAAAFVSFLNGGQQIEEGDRAND